MNDVDISVIKLEEVQRGDFIIVKYDETKIPHKAVGQWAKHSFRKCRANVLLVSHGVDIQMVSLEGPNVKWECQVVSALCFAGTCRTTC